MTTRFPMFITTFIDILTTSVTHHGWMHRLLHKVQQCSFYGQWQYFFLRLCYVILLCHSTLENTIILFKKKKKSLLRLISVLISELFPTTCQYVCKNARSQAYHPCMSCKTKSTVRYSFYAEFSLPVYTAGCENRN